MVGYRMHHDGGVDVRATYTMLAVTEILNITTPHITRGAADYVSACQTYTSLRGSLGYFCALAALRLLGRSDSAAVGKVDADALGGWLARRQMAYEGGFQGRSNKLVDGCYSFWQGGAVAVLNLCYHPRHAGDPHASGIGGSSAGEEKEDDDGLSFDRRMLQRYILLCDQDVNGGLRDKPSKPRDFYHSCYNLSGLSVAQHALAAAPVILGDRERNEVGATHPVFNVRVERVVAALKEFEGEEEKEKRGGVAR